jgi:hypothetical protein
VVVTQTPFTQFAFISCQIEKNTNSPSRATTTANDDVFGKFCFLGCRSVAIGLLLNLFLVTNCLVFIFRVPLQRFKGIVVVVHLEFSVALGWLLVMLLDLGEELEEELFWRDGCSNKSPMFFRNS